MKHSFLDNFRAYTYTFYKSVPLALFVGLLWNSAYAQHIDVRVHDPVMIKQDDTYYLFCTGRGISVWSSKDMKKLEPRRTGIRFRPRVD